MSVAVRAALGLRAQRGGAVVVGVAADGGEPRLLLSTFLATAAEGDRLAFEPYHVAYEMAAGAIREVAPAVAQAVAEGRRRQEVLASKGLEELIGRLRADGFEPAAVALLANRAGWMSDLLAHALSAPEHPPVMEGLAVREALRTACRQRGLDIVELDEKSLADMAAARLGRSSAEIDRTLGALGASAGRPWRREQKLAALAAWWAVA